MKEEERMTNSEFRMKTLRKNIPISSFAIRSSSFVIPIEVSTHGEL